MNHLKQNEFHAISYISSLNICYVCGFSLCKNLADGDICPCCFTEWGVNEHQLANIDGTLTDFSKFILSVKLPRSEWIANGLLFDDIDFKPEGWDRDMALKQIKENVPEEFWKDDPLVNG